MADRGGSIRVKQSASRQKTAAARPADVPDPPAVPHFTRYVWRAGQALHRIHLARHAGAFNPGLEGNARFSPITDRRGKPVPTLYGASSFDGAAMETVFHDVPFAPGFKSYDKRRLGGQMHSVWGAQADLTLADLRNVPLRKLGVERSRLIDTEKDTYARTRKWAVAIHDRHADIQGLCWTSRQDDRAIAVMLFGDRVDADILKPLSASRALLADETAYAELLELADLIGVRIVSGQAW